ncbi:MAG: glycosyltransferase, partial [Ktedonobacterales bacterium]
MRILFLARGLPFPADTTAGAQSLQALRYLGREHETHLVAFSRHAADASLARLAQPLCASVTLVPMRASLPRDAASLTSSLVQGDSYLLRREHTRAMARAVNETLRHERIEAIHIDRIGMAQFITPTWNRPVIVDGRSTRWTAATAALAHTSNPARRWLLRREARILRGMEAMACRRAVVTLAASEEQRATIEHAVGTPWTIHIVPLGVDLAEFEAHWTRREPVRTQLLTMGSLALPHESAALADFLRGVYTILSLGEPDLDFDIVARRPTHRLRAQAAHETRVTLHGESSETASLWQRAGVYLAPVADAEAPVRILQALAAGVPVVASPAA